MMLCFLQGIPSGWIVTHWRQSGLHNRSPLYSEAPRPGAGIPGCQSVSHSGGIRLPPAYLTSHAALHLDDVRGSGEAQAPQHAFPALQLVHLQHCARPLQVPLGGLDVARDLGRAEPFMREIGSPALSQHMVKKTRTAWKSWKHPDLVSAHWD